MDVDGVLTDGTVFISSDGTETKQFSILDGMGLVTLRHTQLHLAWISGRASAATTTRATELKIQHIIQGRTDKLAALQDLASSLQLEARQCCYMGDDDIDAPAIQWAGIGISVIGAMPRASEAARFIPQRLPGRGAVREVCELLVKHRTAVPPLR